jgi:hypothetical protein
MQQRKQEPKRYCNSCKARLWRKVFASGRLEDLGVFKRRRYCDRACMASGMAKAEVCKSTHHWRARRHRKGACERCGSADGLHVHHLDRDWKNDHPLNLQTVCEACHGAEHGAERGEMFAARQWMNKDLVVAIWAACREAADHLKLQPDTRAGEIAALLDEVMRRGGQG